MPLLSLSGYSVSAKCNMNIFWRRKCSVSSEQVSVSSILLGYRRRKQPWPGLFARHGHPAVLEGWAVNPHWQHTQTHKAGLNTHTHMCLHLHSHEVLSCVCEVLTEIHQQCFITVAALYFFNSVFPAFLKKRGIFHLLFVQFKLHPVTSTYFSLH